MMKLNLKQLIGATFLSLLGAVSTFGQTTHNPVANPQAVITSGEMRFTVLTPEMVRVEWSSKKIFEDRASFIVINRNLPLPAFTKTESNGILTIKTEKLTLKYKIGTHPVSEDTLNPNLQIAIQLNGKDVIWYPGKKDPDNLKGTTRTLDGASGDVKNRLEEGLISRSGWAVIDEQATRRIDGKSKSLMLNDDGDGMPWVAQRADTASMDLYFLGYGHNYKKALYDYTLIAGKLPMPPMWAFGYWYSKYQRYSEQDFKNIVNEIEQNDIPLDVMVIDMDWHRDGLTGRTDTTQWTGWSWNKTLIPDPKAFLNWLHQHHLKTTLNLHPAQGIMPKDDNYAAFTHDYGVAESKTIPWKIEDKQFYKAFFKNILRPHEDIGVDFWWLDWQQWYLAKTEPHLSNTFWLNHVFYTDKMLQGKNRPLIYHRWGGLGNHRYQIGFSGDTEISFESLAFQPLFTATASNVLYGYWSHDIGGHWTYDTLNNPELYLRWIQYGVFAPILRTHSTNWAHIERRIWVYDNFPSMLKALRLRYALAPYIYTCARYAYDSGISLCRPLYYDYPEATQAYEITDEYLFGNDILVAPILQSDGGSGTATRTIWLPEGSWYEVATGNQLKGNQIVTRNYTREQIPYFYKEGAIIPLYPKMNNLKNRPDTLILQFAPGAHGEFVYYEDEEDNDNYQTGDYTLTKITQKRTGNQIAITIEPREEKFAGMPDKRAFRLEILSIKKPSKVEFLQGLKGSYHYNDVTQTLTVELPMQGCEKKIEIKIF